MAHVNLTKAVGDAVAEALSKEAVIAVLNRLVEVLEEADDE
jgi:hypothetical protein